MIVLIVTSIVTFKYPTAAFVVQSLPTYVVFVYIINSMIAYNYHTRNHFGIRTSVEKRVRWSSMTANTHKTRRGYCC